MAAKYRIKDRGPDWNYCRYELQKKGWFKWKYVDTFLTRKDAEDHIQELRHLNAIYYLDRNGKLAVKY